MRKGWEIKKFEDCLEKVVYSKKVQRKDFLDVGEYPIISQEQEFINGFWNNSAELFKVNKPVVIFGDHTQVLKYVNFNFVLGADGVKILQPKNNLDSKYLYYFLQNINLENLGYARHYRLLKEIFVIYPTSLSEQQDIVSILDDAFESIERAKSNAKQNLKNAKELFESYLHDIFQNKGEDCEIKKLVNVVDFQRGLTYSKKDEVDFSDNIVLRSNNVSLINNKLDFSELKYINSKITIPENKKVTKGSLIICTANGSKNHLGKVALIDEDYNYAFGGFMGLIKPKENLNPVFLFFMMTSDAYKKFISELSDGANINNLKFSDLGDFEIPIPSLSEQQKIVDKLVTLSAETKKLESIYQNKLNDLEELKKSILQKAFNGELKKSKISE